MFTECTLTMSTVNVCYVTLIKAMFSCFHVFTFHIAAKVRTGDRQKSSKIGDGVVCQVRDREASAIWELHVGLRVRAG